MHLHNLPHKKYDVSDRKFGFTISVIIGLLALYLGYEHEEWNLFLFGTSAVILTLAIVYPTALRPLNIAWFYVGYTLQFVFSPMVLTALFFIILVPLGSARKVYSGLKSQPEKPSWIESESDTEEEGFQHLF